MSNIGCDFDDEGYASPDPVFCLGDTPLPIDRYSSVFNLRSVFWVKILVDDSFSRQF